jgi:hypothetical protein
MSIAGRRGVGMRRLSSLPAPFPHAAAGRPAPRAEVPRWTCRCSRGGSVRPEMPVGGGSQVVGNASRALACFVDRPLRSPWLRGIMTEKQFCPRRPDPRSTSGITHIFSGAIQLSEPVALLGKRATIEINLLSLETHCPTYLLPSPLTRTCRRRPAESPGRATRPGYG